MKIWITGANGMLGSSLLKVCSKRGMDAVGTARSEADVCDLSQLKEKFLEIRPTLIINCAAYTDVDKAESEPERVFAVNAEGAANMARVAKEFSARLMHISTDYVFDGRGIEPYKEEGLCAPCNIYGASKWEGEKKVLEILPEACVLRTSWLFGAQGKNFISSLMRLFQEKEELQVVSDQCGRPTYCHDLAAAVFSLLNAQGIYHFANEEKRSRYEIALHLLEILKTMGIAVKCKRIVPVLSAQFPTPAPRPSYSVLDTDKYFHHTKIKPRPFGEAVREFLSDAYPL